MFKQSKSYTTDGEETSESAFIKNQDIFMHKAHPHSKPVTPSHLSKGCLAPG